MADATTAAKDRIDRALAALERKVLELKARPATAPGVGDDDLFAPVPSSEADRARIRDLELAGHDASRALAEAATSLRDMMAGSRDGAGDD